MHALRRVSASSGAAAPLGCVIFFVFFEIVACTSRARSFLCVQCGGGITTLGTLYMLSKRPAPACEND